jgi:hypothetical protein
MVVGRLVEFLLPVLVLLRTVLVLHVLHVHVPVVLLHLRVQQVQAVVLPEQVLKLVISGQEAHRKLVPVITKTALMLVVLLSLHVLLLEHVLHVHPTHAAAGLVAVFL